MLNPTPSALSSLFLTRWFLASFFRVRGDFDVLNPKFGPPDDTDPRSRKSTGDPQILAVSGKYKLCNPHTPSDSRPLSRQATFLLKFFPDPPTRSVARRSTAWHVTASFPNHILISNLMKLLQNIQSVSTLFRNVNPEISRKGQEASLEKTLPRKVSKEYEKSLLRKRQGLLHLFFFARNSRQQRQLYNKLSQDAVFINRTLSQRFFFISPPPTAP